MTTQQRKILEAFREFLWAAVCWNEHNFQEGMLAEKCKRICRDLGITNAEQANQLLDRFERDLERQEKT